MTTEINCHFARCAVQYFVSSHFTPNHKFPKGTLPQIVREYNNHFSNEINLQVKYSTASKHFVTITRRFNAKWHHQETRTNYLVNFNREAWGSLSQTEKNRHTLSSCKACQEEFPQFVNAFPTLAKRGKKSVTKPKKICPTINLTERDLSSPAALGGCVLSELTSISQQLFNKTGQEILIETPRSNLTNKPTAKVSKKKRRDIEREIRNAIAIDKEEVASSLVLQNRISWNTYDRIRKSEAMTSPKQQATTPVQGLKRKYHNLSETLEIDKENLLHEAETWAADKNINWSQLARDYGLASPNGGQIIKRVPSRK